MEKHQRGSGIIQVLLILVIAGFVGFVGWYIWHSKDNADISSNIQTEGNKAATDTTNQNTTSQTNPVTLKIDDYSLELKVPETLKDLAIGRSRTGTIDEAQKFKRQDNTCIVCNSRRHRRRQCHNSY